MVARQAATLLGCEMALAKAELAAQARQLSFGGAGLAAAAGLGLCGGLAMIAAAALGLAQVVPGWAAALIVSGAALALAAIAGTWAARRLRGLDRPLPLTTESLNRDVQLLRSTWR